MRLEKNTDVELRKMPFQNTIGLKSLKKILISGSFGKPSLAPTLKAKIPA